MDPIYWLLIVIACCTVLCFIVAALFYGIGWDKCDEHHAALDAERHRHREQDPVPGVLLELPPVGELSAFPEPEPAPDRWVFAGGWDQGPVAVSAEYELLTQTAEQPAVEGVDTPSDFTRKVDELLAKYETETNLFIFSMKDTG